MDAESCVELAVTCCPSTLLPDGRVEPGTSGRRNDNRRGGAPAAAADGGGFEVLPGVLRQLGLVGGELRGIAAEAGRRGEGLRAQAEVHERRAAEREMKAVQVRGAAGWGGAREAGH